MWCKATGKVVAAKLTWLAQKVELRRHQVAGSCYLPFSVQAVSSGTFGSAFCYGPLPAFPITQNTRKLQFSMTVARVSVQTLSAAAVLPAFTHVFR